MVRHTGADTKQEIVVDTATGGRTTYRNASNTRRRGFEAEWDGDLGAGVTARFNLNVLVRINRELGGNFDISGFIHRAI